MILNNRKLNRKEILYIKTCIVSDIAYRKYNNYLPVVDDELEKMGQKIIDSINYLLECDPYKNGKAYYK